MKYTKKPVEIEAITFDELVEYGKSIGANIVNGMPWSFDYRSRPITHENDTCYLIPTLEGTMKFTPDDMLITGVKGEIYPCKKDIFEMTYNQSVSSGLTFGAVLKELSLGKAVARDGWAGKGLFVVKQIPSTIGLDIIPKMQSLPASAKSILIAREQPIHYANQILIVNSEGRADSWVPSSSDLFAEDWFIVE